MGPHFLSFSYSFLFHLFLFLHLNLIDLLIDNYKQLPKWKTLTIHYPYPRACSNKNKSNKLHANKPKPSTKSLTKRASKFLANASLIISKILTALASASLLLSKKLRKCKRPSSMTAFLWKPSTRCASVRKKSIRPSVFKSSGSC